MKQFVFSPLGRLSYFFVEKQAKFNVFATKLGLWDWVGFVAFVDKHFLFRNTERCI